MPIWLYREIQRRGPGDYAIVTPTFTLLEVKALPEFLNLFKRTLKLGEYTSSPVRRFRFSPDGERRTFGHVSDVPTQVFFGYAENPDSLASATYKAVAMDEAGQEMFKVGSWEEIQRRLAIHQGRALITTTPYNVTGWLKAQIFDKWCAGDPMIDVISFPSIANPSFPREEYERARQTLPLWKFDLFYNGKFTRPAGLIYDSFDEAVHTCPRFRIPDEWPRYLGLDFGGVHTAALFLAAELPKLDDGEWDVENPTGRYYLYREYLAGGRTGREHAEQLLRGEPNIPVCVGGSKSEGQWRMEFRSGGLPVREPDISEVELGIGRVYGAFKTGKLLIFDDCAGLLEELRSYSRKLDALGEPTEAIEDKASYHRLDSLRYIMGWLMRTNRPGVR